MKYILIKVPDDLFIGGEGMPHCELNEKELTMIFVSLGHIPYKITDELSNKIRKVLENDIK